MRKIIYIIPGLGENCDLMRYKFLATTLKDRGYIVQCVNPDWYQTLSSQVFHVERDAIICGFSFGAVLAYLTAKKYPCRKVIFASISPIHTFTFRSLVVDYAQYMDIATAKILAKDIKNIKVSLRTFTTPFVTLVGEKEKLNGQVVVPSTGHYLTKKYVECIDKLV